MNEQSSPIHIFTEHFVFFNGLSERQEERSGRCMIDFEDIKKIKEFVGDEFQKIRDRGIELVILIDYVGDSTIIECSFAEACRLLKKAKLFSYLSKISFMTN